MNRTPLPPNEPDGPTPKQLAAECAAILRLSMLDRLKFWVSDNYRPDYVIIYAIATDDGCMHPQWNCKATFGLN
jgi:hypothetical protein